MTSCVNKMSGLSVPTTASASREGNCKSRQIHIAATTSGSGCGSIAIWMGLWPSFMVRENWLIMISRENSKNSKKRPDRSYPQPSRNANVRRSPPAQKSGPMKNRKSGQIICYKTGHFYLLLKFSRNINYYSNMQRYDGAEWMMRPM